ncbi:MAG: BON domain-containing protein [Rickettsiales bacterium]|nr:BON domain-containing protein [Rickettsiales bacterium]
MNIRTALLVIVSLLALEGCRSLAISSVSRVSESTTETRSFGRSVDDASLYTRINHHFLQSDVSGLLTNITVRVYEGRVFLFGRVKGQRTADDAERLVWLADGVKEVVNEIQVGDDGNAIDFANDEAIETQISTRLLATKGIHSANFTSEVVHGVAYLIGTARDERELNAVVQVARRTSGVKRVVSHVRIKGDPAATPDA